MEREPDVISMEEKKFLFWKIDGNTLLDKQCIDNNDEIIIVHIIVKSGELTMMYGDETYHLHKNSFASFIEKKSFKVTSKSSNIDAYIMVMYESYSFALLKNNPPMPFSFFVQIRKCPIRIASDIEMSLLAKRMNTIYEAYIDNMHLFRDKMIKCAVWMLLCDVANTHFYNEKNINTIQENNSRVMILFRDFLRLLVDYATKEHFVNFYADKMCITPQYLNRIAKKISGRTASQWIDYTLCGEITKRLENTTDTIQQIAKELHFPDQSTLTKFYKRQMDCTPSDYKKRM